MTYCHRVSSVVVRKTIYTKAYSSLTLEWITSIFGVKHHWGRTIILYINELGPTPGDRGAGLRRDNFTEIWL